MKGKMQAVLATTLLGVLPLVNLLNPALIGLWVLRKGFRQTFGVTIWAVLPLVGWALAGDMAPLMMMAGICGLASTLRTTNSWEFTLIAAIGVGLAIETYFRVQPAMLDTLFQQVQSFIQNDAEVLQGENIKNLVISGLASSYMFLSIGLTMLSRWMQAGLFNPGGFQEEFHKLRIGHRLMLLLVSGMILASFGVFVPETWYGYFRLTLVFSGISLVHAVCAKRQIPVTALVVFYILLPVTFGLVALLAVIDSWYDFRGRVKQA
jgi:hypothetical protein